MSTIYLIKRGPKQLDRTCVHPSVMLHPVVICDRRAVAKWEAGWSGDGSTVWERESIGGFLLVKHEGMDVDYGHLVRSFTFADGRPCGAFYHDRNAEPWTLIKGAIWWSVKKLPAEYADLGVVYPEDDFTREKIERDYDTDYSRRDCKTPKRWEDLPDRKLAPWALDLFERVPSGSNINVFSPPTT